FGRTLAIVPLVHVLVTPCKGCSSARWGSGCKQYVAVAGNADPRGVRQRVWASGGSSDRYSLGDLLLRPLGTRGQEKYGTSYPVEFETGSGRQPAHLTFDVALGR